MSAALFRVGDWLLVVQEGRPVVAIVIACQWDGDYPSGWRYITTLGLIHEDAVREYRRAPEPAA